MCKVEAARAYCPLICVLVATACGCSEDKPTGSGMPTLSLTRSTQVFEPARTFQIALADIDGDGDLDAIFSNMGENSSSVWLNDGSGRFTDSGQELTQWGHGVGARDLDGDGDVDLVITCASYTHRTRIYLNDGGGNLSDSGQDLGDTSLSGNEVHLADIDTDGDLDLVVVYYEEPDKLYLNDGQGRFTDSGRTIPEQSFFGRLNADEYVDIFAKDYGTGYKTMLNDGDGSFTDLWQMADTSAVYGAVAVEDLDDDGDLDAFVCNGDHSGTYPTKILLNGGDGRFSDSGQALDVTVWGRVGIGDLNGDGSADAFVSCFGLANQVWLNNGGGRFTDSGLRLTGDANDNTTCVTLGDLNGDGSLDAFVANFADGGNEVWFSGR
jgi:hypothetical protein